MIGKFQLPITNNLSDSFSGLRSKLLSEVNSHIKVILLLWVLPFCVVSMGINSCEQPFLPPEQTVPPAPPKQPSFGPGGTDYKYGMVIKNVYGEGGGEYWIFEPASPHPESAPLIVLLHGYGGMYPRPYGAWIEHLVRSGNIVVYPRYQETLRDYDQVYPNAANAVADAIKRLESGEHVKPQLDKFALVGHSCGGGISANIASQAISLGLPQPKALMLVEPGDGSTSSRTVSGDPIGFLVDPGGVPANILMLVVTASEYDMYDQFGNDLDRKIFYETSQIPLANKDFVTVVSDYHCEPPLVAGHFSPCAPDDNYYAPPFLSSERQEIILNEILKKTGAISTYTKMTVDALDYYCYWKLFDGLIDAAFYGKNRKYALDNTSQQKFMGICSDGTPVAELIVTKNP